MKQYIVDMQFLIELSAFIHSSTVEIENYNSNSADNFLKQQIEDFIEVNGADSNVKVFISLKEQL